MSRLKERAARKAAETQTSSGFWPDLCERIAAGQLIPIISTAVVNDKLFDMNNDQVLGFGENQDNPHGWTIEEQLADAWATEIGFPLPEKHQLPRIALFDRIINSADNRAAKKRYLTWLKEALLFLAEEDNTVSAETIAEQRGIISESTFADIAAALGYPRQAGDTPNPLTTLARLKLPIYITTSPFDFMERAIQADRRRPRTQLCFWSGESVTFVDESHRTDPGYIPTPENPLVYHIFGLETYPNSMVLSEDDYLDFLATIARDTDPQKPLLPLYLRKALTQSSIILLGYNLRDWDFRVLCRGIISPLTASIRPFSLAIQIDPGSRGQLVDSADQIRSYLEKYFHSVNFTVAWDTPEGFVNSLWKEWDKWRR